MKQIQRRGQLLKDAASPLICTPLVGKTCEQLFDVLDDVIQIKPDLIEWRVDYFEDVGNTATVIDVASRIKEKADSIPVIFSCRSVKEGGECIALDDDDVVKLYVAACASCCVDIIDYETGNAANSLAHLRRASRDNDVAMIMSYHNVQSTPNEEFLTAKFIEAERLGADIAKVSVMPTGPEDVLTLLEANMRASEACSIPLIGVSMGGYGSLSKMFGWAYGSAVTYAVATNSSTPGQVHVDELRAVLSAIRRTVTGSQGAIPNILVFEEK
jgi:3-dehydroquinate dehydratase I